MLKVILLMYFSVILIAVPSGICKVAVIISLWIRGKKVYLKRPLITSATVKIKIEMNITKVKYRQLRAVFKKGLKIRSINLSKLRDIFC